MVLAVLLVLGWFTACDNSHGFIIHRLDTQLPKGEMPEDDRSLAAAKLLFEVSGYDYLDVFTLSEYANKESVTAHIGSVDSVFGSDLSREERALGRALYKLSEDIPGFQMPEIYSIISPFSQSVIVADSVVFVGLNHYLGASYRYYGFFPEYLRQLKNRSQLPIDVVDAILRVKVPFNRGRNQSTLEHMIYYGALTEAVMQSLGVDEKSALGMTDAQMDWLKDNEQKIWHTIIEKKLLYNTDLSIARSLLEPAPSTFVLTPDAPGRAGRFTAYKLVRSYLKKHPGVTYIDLLQGKIPADASFITESRYNP